MIRIIPIATLLWLATPNVAYAYIDPGIASIILQSLVATIAAVSATLGLFWHRIKAFFKIGEQAPEAKTTQSDDAD